MTENTEYIVGYAVASLEEGVVATEDQVKAIEKRGHELPGIWRGCFAEVPAHAARSWRERAVLQEILGALRRGDHLIAWRPDRLDRAPARLADALAYLGRQDIHLHFLAFDGQALDLDPNASCAMALLLVKSLGMYHQVRQDVSRESVQRRRQQGLATSAFPGYGRRRIRTRHGKADVWDSQQCAILRELKMRRDAGEQWAHIAADFHKRGLRTGGNQRWVHRRKWRGEVHYQISRLLRAYRWYRDLLAQGKDLEL